MEEVGHQEIHPVHGRAYEHQNRLADIAGEKKRFADVGVEYEVWSPRQLQERLPRPPSVVSQFVGAAFVDILCGEGVDAALLGEALAIQVRAEEGRV